MTRNKTFYISIDRLIISPLYFRWMINDKHVRNLANSIAKYGQKVPLLVRRLHDGKYEILDGVHRYLACKLLQITKVKVTLTDMDYLEALKYVNSVSHNILKFNVVDRMHQIIILAKHYKKTPVEIAKELGISTRTVERYLTIWEYTDDEEKRKIIEGKLSLRKAYLLAIERKNGKKRRSYCILCNDYVKRVKPVFLCPNHAYLLDKLSQLLKTLPPRDETLRVLALWNDVTTQLREQNVLDDKYVKVMRFFTELATLLYGG